MSDANEVAEDYRLALEDLSTNMRFEISNLTVIARENTEHALTIADVLQTHILKAAPSKKLPALYVLDSIVKNVGTPYTLYFGRNLFKIFMESYAVVDNPIRKKMEEMLRTWKDPVPGSMDMRPVFSHELVRPIENALMKVRAASMPQQAAIPGRPRQPMFPQRDTPTPPGMRGPGQYPPQGQPFPNTQQPQYSRPSPQPYGSGQGPYQPPVAGQYGAPVGITVDNLPNDIQNLIHATRDELSQNGHDQAIQIRLKALMDLQAVVQRGGIPPDQLELIKNKVTELAPVTRRSVSAQPPPSNTSNLQPQMQPRQSASVTPTPGSGGPSAPPVSLDALLGQGALAALMARTTSNSQNSTPNPPPSAAIRSPPPPAHVQVPQPASAPNDPMALLNKLRQAGMLSGLNPQSAATNTPPPPPPPSALPAFPANLAGILAMAKANAAANPNPVPVHNVSSMAFKKPFNPNFVNKLYDDLGPPCTQCGRRFRTDEEGRKKKTAHMDWHFKVYQRSVEAEKRGMHRSWYVDQQEWVKSREAVDVDHVAAPEGADAQAGKVVEGPKYIHVPEPGSGINNTCPICQDRFENKWLDLAQDWVWLDAVLVRNRAFHASCLAEASKDRDGTPRRTPEPVLGKRKAEPGMASPKIRTLRTAI